jgi:hypothetical protein
MSTIITRNSATSGSVPSSLIQGELAINVKDGRLFYGSGSGNVVKEFVASGSGGGGTVNTGSFVTTSSFNAYTGSNTSQFAGTASYATYAANGGVTKILAGANVNLSPVSGLGDVTVTSFGTNLYNTATGSYGSFYDTGSVLAASTTAVYSMSLNTTDISNGVFVSSSNGDVTRVKFTNAGTYNIQFSSQFSNSDNSTQDAIIWIRKNGTDIPDSSGVVGVPPFKAGSNGQAIGGWNYYLSLSAGDFIQMCWHVEQANVITLETIPAGVGPTHPRTPSTILTATRVDTFLSNTGSFSGSFTGTLTGTASYSTNALSASYAPSTPAFPYTGSALITGSLGITGSLSVSGSIIARSSIATPNSLARWSGSAGGLLTLTGSILNSNNTQVWAGTIDSNTFVTLYPITSSTVTGLSVYSPFGNGSTGISTTATSIGIYAAGGGNGVISNAFGGQFIGIDATTAYGVYSSIGITEFGSVTTGIGGYFDGKGSGAYAYPTNMYSVQLVDGTEGIGKVLVSQTSDGKANWAQTVNSASVAVTASYARTALSSSYALSASYAPSTPAFPYTGSAGITGSLTVVGPTTSTQIGAGAAPSGSVPLDIRAQGALSTDIAFRVRNSANNANIFKIQGDANASLGETTDANQKTFSVNASSNSRLVLGSGYSTDTGVFSLTRRYYATVTVFNDNALLLSHNSFSDGNNIPYKHHYVNPSTYYGSVPAYGYNAGFMWFKDSAVIANLQMKLSPDNVLSIYTSSASPLEAIITGSAFQLWASGSLGNAKPYIRTQNGTLLYLGDQSLLYNVTASSITSSFTGSLLGTASYATQALSASWAPGGASTPAFPYTGSALITGSLGVTGSVSITQNLTSSRAFISSSNGTISGSSLTVYGSGSAQPVFTVQGSQGELFSITDSLSGSLFSVNDISGLPIMEVFSDNTTLMGSYLAPSLNTTAKVVQTNSGSFTMYSLPTASYDTAFFEYSVRSGSNARAGTIMAIQSGSAVNFTETTTTDFGSTSAVSFTVIVTGSNIALTGSSTSGAWTIKTIVRSI